MNRQLEFNGSRYIHIGGTWYDRETFIKPPQIICSELDRLTPDLHGRPAVPIRAKVSRKPVSDTPAKPAASFTHERIFPLIANAIRRKYLQLEDYVEHDDIVDELLVDPDARSMILAAREAQGSTATIQAVASNMIAWFSQRITIHKSPYEVKFRRKKIRRAWAYRPIDV